MTLLRAYKALGPIDARSIWRDPLLGWMVFLPLVIGALVRLAIPWITDQVWIQFGLDLRPYYPVIVVGVFTMLPLLFGMVIGFVLLDQRDDRTLLALRITPLSLRGYLLYRITMPMLLTIPLILVVTPMMGLMPVPWQITLLMAAAVAPLSPIIALTLGTFAQNKVQGFALTKAMGVVLLPVVIAYFWTSPAQLVLGLDPAYWPAQAFYRWAAGAEDMGMYVLVGLVYQALLLVVLSRRLERLSLD